jgi:ribokinase
VQGHPLITVLGSLHYDVIVMAPDCPRKGETLAGSSWLPKCGGKGGNQACAAARAGAAVAMVGVVGDDVFGRALSANLERNGVDRRHVRTTSGAATGMSVAIVDAEGDYGAVIVSGANLRLGLDDVAAAADVIARSSVLVLQNEAPEAANASAAALARRTGVRTLLNAAPARRSSPELAAAVDILVVNAVEAVDLSGQPVRGQAEALAAATSLSLRFAHVVVTLGGDGLVYAGTDGGPFALPARSVKVASTHGAGDEFIGVFAARLATGDGIRTALDAANAAAARLVETPEAERSSSPLLR